MSREAFYNLDEVEQDDWIARWEIERDTCQRCGSKRDECENPEHEWYPQKHVDFAEMSQKAAQWMWESKHEKEPYHDGSFTNWAKDRSSQFPFHRDDGVTIWVSRLDLTPDDDFI